MKEFIKSVFSDTDNSGNPIGSFSRVISAVIVGFVMGWDSYFLIHSKVLPDATTLVAQGGFMVLFYGANRTADTVKKFSGDGK